MKRLFLLIVYAFIMNTIMMAEEPLTRGTFVAVRLISEISSKSNNFPSAVVEQDIRTRSGAILISKGTRVDLDVKPQAPRGCGRPGSVQVRCISTTSVDGQRIALEGGTSAVGESKKGKSIGLAVGLTCGTAGFGLPFLAFLAIKGNHAIIPTNTMLSNVFVAADYYVGQ